MVNTINNYIQSFMRKIKGNELYYGIGLLLLLCGLWWLMSNKNNASQPVIVEQPIVTANEDGMIGGGPEKQLVLYYADWCGACQALKPRWDELSSKYNGTQVGEYKITIDKINTDEFPDKVREQNIKAFPTIIMYKNGDRSIYNGDRSMESLEQFVQN